MNNSIRQSIIKLADGIKHADYTRQRQESTKVQEVIPDITPLLKRGIADLDFDPYLFLKTGETYSEEWSQNKK